VISPERFRVSKPGADVDSTNISDFMLHESFLAAQPYFFAYVANPFAGNTGNSSQTATVDVTVPDVDANPAIIIFPVTNDSRNTYPFPRDEGSGSDQNGYNVNDWYVYCQIVSSTQATITFYKPVGSKKSPNGCYLALVRRS
jgi:hypothetical protein